MPELLITFIKSLDCGLILQNFAATGFGAWLGARYAFKNDKKINDEEKLKAEIERSKFAQFVLISHIHFSKNVWNQYLRPQYSNTEARHFKLKRFDFTEKVPSFDFQKLSFMLDEQDSNMLYRLFLHERKFLNFVDSIKTRNNFYNHLMNDKTESADSLAFLKQLTCNMYHSYEQIDSASSEVIFNDLTAYLNKRYPNTNFLKTK